MIERLAVIGVGLIGGSLARALRAAGAVGEVVGCGRSAENLKLAVELGVIDRFTHDPAEAVDGADTVFVAVPLGAIRGVLAALDGRLRADAVVTDGGSVKGSVVADAAAVFGRVPAWLVPGHPIAGTERSGVEASFPELYHNRRVILTPLPETDPEALARVTRMWETAGARVSCMDVAHHDEILAATSHLPHMLAFGLVDALSRMRENDEIFRYAAGGFRDFTRIASSSPVMWRDICMANREALGAMLGRFSVEMGELADSIRQGDGEHLLAIFERAKTARDRFVDGLGVVPAPPPGAGRPHVEDDEVIRVCRSDAGNSLSAWSPHGFELDGARWPSAEHYYQGMKFEEPAMREAVRTSPLPRDAQRWARDHRRHVRRDWNGLRRDVMARGVYLKCIAHPDAAAALLATGERPIIETNQDDGFWGWGKEGRGENTFGRVLMEVRERLREGGD